MPDRFGLPTVEEIAAALAQDYGPSEPRGYGLGGSAAMMGPLPESGDPRSNPLSYPPLAGMERETFPGGLQQDIPHPVEAAAPQTAPGGGFGERLGMALHQNPVSYQPRRGSSDLEDFVGNFLSSGANAFGGATANTVTMRQRLDESLRQQQAERTKRNLDATERARERASRLGTDLAKHRWDREREERAREQGLKDKLDSEGRANTEWERRRGISKQDDLDLIAARGAQERATRLAVTDGEADPSLAPEAQAIHEGRIDLPLANKRRSALIAYMDQHGMDYTPKAVKEVVAEVGPMKEALRQLKEADSGLTRGRSGPDRFIRGLGIVGDAVTQKEGSSAPDFVDKRESFKAAIARLAGHVGVLTERDVQTAIRMIPDEFATRAFADRKWADLEAFLNSKIEAKLKAYTQPGAGLKQTDTATQADIDYVKSLGISP